MPGKKQEKDGVWRTVGGRRIFIADGESLSNAMAKSGKFKNQNKNKKQKSLSQLNRQYRRVEDKWANAKDVRRKVKYSDLADKISKKREEAADREEKEIKERSQKSSKPKYSKREALKKDLAKQYRDAENNGNEARRKMTEKELERIRKEEKEEKDDDYNPRGEVNYWLSKGEFDKASKVIKENGLEDEVEDFLEGMKTPGGRSDFRKYLKRHPISETKKKIEEKDVKQAFKDYWDKKISGAELEAIKEDSGLSSGRLDSLKYQASREDDVEKKNTTVNSQTGRKPITNQKEYETAIEALNYIAKQVNETEDPKTKAALEKVMDNYQKDLNEYKKSKGPTSEELKGIKTVKQLHAIADKYGLMPSEVQDMAGLKDRDLFESARQEDEEYKKKFENDAQAAERFLKADEASRPTSNTQSQTFKSKKDYDRQIESLGKVKEDGTFDLTTLKSKNYDGGYQVTFSMTDMDMDDESYTKLVEKFKNHDHGNVDAGKFDGYSEISFNVDDIKKAAKLAYKYNQVSIWDWKNGKEILTRGTGKWEDYKPETVSQQVKTQRQNKRKKKLDSLKNRLKK